MEVRRCATVPNSFGLANDVRVSQITQELTRTSPAVRMERRGAERLLLYIRA
jgi:hypothetical protein